MTKSMVVKWFFGSLIGLAGGLVLLIFAGALALGNDVFVMNGPDVAGIRPGALSWTLAAMVGLAVVVMLAAGVAQFVAWIGAVLNTAGLPSKNWCVLLLIAGLLGFVFVATLVYVIAGPDSTVRRPQAYPNPQVPAGHAEEPVMSRADGAPFVAGGPHK
jgi:hypothetical protein